MFNSKIISNDWKIEPEVLHRIKKGTSAYYEMNNFIRGENEISKKVKTTGKQL